MGHGNSIRSPLCNWSPAYIPLKIFLSVGKYEQLSLLALKEYLPQSVVYASQSATDIPRGMQFNYSIGMILYAIWKTLQLVWIFARFSCSNAAHINRQKSAGWDPSTILYSVLFYSTTNHTINLCLLTMLTRYSIPSQSLRTQPSIALATWPMTP